MPRPIPIDPPRVARGRMRYRYFLVGLIAIWALWGLGVFTPRLPMLLGVAVYIAVGLAVAHSALKHRSSGWISGMLLAGVLLTLPLWIGAMVRAYERWQK